MSIEAHDDDCPGCKPVLFDPKTQQLMAEDEPAMVALNRVWEATSLAERQAFHRCTCLNSRDPEDLSLSSRASSTD